MVKKISILGSGWLGWPLSIDLSEKGHLVKASNRSTSKFEELKEQGISPFIIDISEKENGYSEFLDSEILIILITSKDIDSFKNLIEQIEQSTIKRVIFISSTSVYPNSNSVVTENSPTIESALSEIEELFRKNISYKTTIIRFAGLFGYNRKPGNFFQNGRIIDQPEGFVNMIHRDDCVSIIEQIIEKNVWGETLNGSADTHPTRREYYTKQILKEGHQAPVFNENSENEYKIVSNKKIKELLNFEFKYSDILSA